MSSAEIGGITTQLSASDSGVGSQELLPKAAVDLLAQTIEQEIGILQNEELLPVRRHRKCSMYVLSLD